MFNMFSLYSANIKLEYQKMNNYVKRKIERLLKQFFLTLNQSYKICKVNI
jgi:hypothetical protein